MTDNYSSMLDRENSVIEDTCGVSIEGNAGYIWLWIIFFKKSGKFVM